MSISTNYTFRKGQEAYNGLELIYEELGHKLVLYLERSGVTKLDLIVGDTAFQKWTEPAGEEISADQRETIYQRLSDWSRQQLLRIGIESGRSGSESVRSFGRRPGFGSWLFSFFERK